MTITLSETSAAVRAQWNAAAEGWDSQTPVIRSWLREPTQVMFAMAGIQPGHVVLDLAAGAGDQTIDLASRVGPDGRIVATDISPSLVERLRENVRRAGIDTVEARVADARAPMPETSVYDAAICRLGLMLMPEPGRAVEAVAAALKPGAGFCAVVFGGPEENPCIRIMMSIALKHAGMPPRDPFAPGSLFSLGGAGTIESLFRTSGLRHVVTTKLDAPFRLPSVRDYIAFARAAAAPVKAVLQQLDDPTREKAWSEMEDELSRFAAPGGWEGPNTLILAAGRR